MLYWLYSNCIACTPQLGELKLSECVQHVSVSTVAFKFQAHHLFHIFKFDVQEFRLGTT